MDIASHLSFSRIGLRADAFGKILAVLRLNPEQAKKARKLLGQLLERGEIVRIKKTGCASSKTQTRSRAHSVSPERRHPIPDSAAGKKGAPGHPVAAEDTGTALHGDQVLARVLQRPNKYFRGRRERSRRRPETPSDDKPNVRVIRILKRARSRIVGNLCKGRHTWYVIPDDPRIIQDFIVPDPANTGIQPLPQEGDKVVVQMLEWTQRHLNPEERSPACWARLMSRTRSSRGYSTSTSSTRSFRRCWSRPRAYPLRCSPTIAPAARIAGPVHLYHRPRRCQGLRRRPLR